MMNLLALELDLLALRPDVPDRARAADISVLNPGDRDVKS
jgi:hypothetical protein